MFYGFILIVMKDGLVVFKIVELDDLYYNS